MSVMKEFKEFAARGNVVDLAVGLVIGAAFGKIVTSFVSDILMPPIGLALGHLDFSNLFINLSGQPYATLKAAKDEGAATVNYGLFLNTIIDFLIVAFAIFLVVKQVNRFKGPAPEPPPPPVTRDCPFCQSAISPKASRCPHCTSEVKAVAI